MYKYACIYTYTYTHMDTYVCQYHSIFMVIYFKTFKIRKCEASDFFFLKIALAILVFYIQILNLFVLLL